MVPRDLLLREVTVIMRQSKTPILASFCAKFCIPSGWMLLDFSAQEMPLSNKNWRLATPWGVSTLTGEGGKSNAFLD